MPADPVVPREAVQKLACAGKGIVRFEGDDGDPLILSQSWMCDFLAAAIEAGAVAPVFGGTGQNPATYVSDWAL